MNRDLPNKGKGLKTEPRQEKKSRGFALVYAMLVSVVFIVFFAALTLSVRDTMRAVQTDESLVKARALAATGNELAFHLLRTQGSSWIQGSSFTFSNESGAPDYFAGVSNPTIQDQFSEQNMGGIFRVRFVSTDDAEANGIEVPTSGTFMVMVSEATVNNRTTRASSSSRFLVKMGAPFINNVFCSRGIGVFSYNSDVTGPMVVTNFPPNPGEVQLLAHTAGFDLTNPAIMNIQRFTTPIGGEIQVKGQVYLINKTLQSIASKVPLQKLHYMANEQETIPAQTIPGSTLTGLGIGGVEFSSETTIDDEVTMQVRVPDTDEVFRGVRALTISSDNSYDLSSETEGMLLEFEGPNVSLYQARRQKVGRVFDLALVVSYFENILAHHADVVSIYTSVYGSNLQAYEAAIAEAEWNDPAFSETLLPDQLRQDALAQYQALNPAAVLSDIPTQGDYFDQYEIVPAGPAVKTWTLNSTNWTVLRFSSSVLSAADDQGGSIAPPLFVRGRVQGKVLVSYDLDDSLLPLDFQTHRGKCDVVVLTDPRGTVSGGIRLADESVVTDYHSTAVGSSDQVMILSRGNTKAAGLPYFSLGWVSQSAAPNVRRNLLAEVLPTLTPEDEKYMVAQVPGRVCDFFGVSTSGSTDLVFSNLSANFRPRTVDTNPESRFSNKLATSFLVWSDLSGPRDPLLLDSHTAVVPSMLRYAYRPHSSAWHTRGAHAALEPYASGSLYGKQVYDYRWRALDMVTLKEQMGLPVGPMLINREGR